MNAGRAPVMAVLVAMTGFAVAGCGSHQSDRPEATNSASDTAGASPGAVPIPSSTPHPGSTKSARPTGGEAGVAERSVVSGTITKVGDLTATVAGPDGSVPISWTPGTVVVDTVDARRKDVQVGTCVLVLPPAGGPTPTATTITAAVVRVVGASPSCAPIPGTTPTGQTSPRQGDHAGDEDAGSVTIVGGDGVIGTVSAKSRTSFTLRSRDGGRTRTVSVSTSAATQFRKAGDHPRKGVAVGRCATVWGADHDGARLVATRIRLSDPGDAPCGT